MQRAMKISNVQEARGNRKLVENFIEINASNQTLVEAFQRRNSHHTIPLTWTRRNHPATIYNDKNSSIF